MSTATGLRRRCFLLGAAATLAMPSVAGAARPGSGGGGTGGPVIGGPIIGGPVFGGPDPAKAGQVEQRVRQFMSEFSAPGVSLAYGRGGTISFAGAYGLADNFSGETMTPEHRFRIASISKPITAAAIMMLVEQGRLRRDHKVFGAGGPLSAWIPIDGSYPHADWLQAITVDHLLTHTAGGWTNDGADPMFRHAALGHRDLIASTLREAPLINPPGSAYAYSNFGYCLLGRIIEAATGQGYAQVVRSQLAGPAGAQSLEIGGNTQGERKAGEVDYFGQSGDNPFGFNLARMDSHGGWIASASDLVKIAQRINGDDSVADLIAAQSVNMMRAPSSASQTYGRGWAINPGHSNRWHGGALPGATSLLILAAGGTVMAGLVNTRTIDGRDTNQGLDRLLWDVNGLVNA